MPHIFWPFRLVTFGLEAAGRGELQTLVFFFLSSFFLFERRVQLRYVKADCVLSLSVFLVFHFFVVFSKVVLKLGRPLEPFLGKKTLGADSGIICHPTLTNLRFHSRLFKMSSGPKIQKERLVFLSVWV